VIAEGLIAPGWGVAVPVVKERRRNQRAGLSDWVNSSPKPPVDAAESRGMQERKPSESRRNPRRVQVQVPLLAQQNGWNPSGSSRFLLGRDETRDETPVTEPAAEHRMQNLRGT